tara:strand:+ start:17768 stop:18373 length:606 start_codon:yes stop_codon:yes gene_type:complete
MENKVLLIFTKNPELGKCKTRLAKTLGDEKALSIYCQLLEHTRTFSARVDADKHVYYSSNIPENDLWSTNDFERKLQSEGDLGEKMSSAFKHSFEAGYRKVVIIGSDCAEINEQDIDKAFDELDSKDVVLGPAIDGGYYLLGMREFYPFLFSDKSWSTPNLINETISDLIKNGKSYQLLEEKSDIDYEEDLERTGFVSFEY